MSKISGAVVFNGRKTSREKEAFLRQKIATLDYQPKLVAVLIGDDPASKIFLRLKKEAARRVGIEFELIKLTELIEEKNQDPKVTGIMVQLPIPDEYRSFINLISPEKDVDCLTKESLKLLALGKPRFYPAVVKAILQIIQSSNHLISNSHICLVGYGELIGQPLAAYLKSQKAKFSVCRSSTPDLAKQTRKADILVVATGRPKLITGKMVKPGAVVIDCGSPMPEVDFESVKHVASFITPVPGGVGPMTVISLLENLLP